MPRKRLHDYSLAPTREERIAARWTIIQETNKHLLRVQVHPLRPVPLRTMKDLHRCVNVARRYNLVPPDVLLKAGFNVHPKSKNRRSTHRHRTRPRTLSILDRLSPRR